MLEGKEYTGHKASRADIYAHSIDGINGKTALKMSSELLGAENGHHSQSEIDWHPTLANASTNGNHHSSKGIQGDSPEAFSEESAEVKALYKLESKSSAVSDVQMCD